MSKNKLAVFDFDGTLVNTPEEATGRVIYETTLGKSWVIDNDAQALASGFDKAFRRRGWWGRVETLYPPIVERPAKPELVIDMVHHAYATACIVGEVQCVLVTGRHSKLKPDIEKLLGEVGIKMDEYFYKGMQPWCKHPEYKDDTPNWKMFAIREAAMRPEYTHLEIWEDREDVVELFTTKLIEDLQTRWPQLTYVEINDVKRRRRHQFTLTIGELRKLIGDLEEKWHKKME